MGSHLIYTLRAELCEFTHPDQMLVEQETAAPAMAPFSTSCKYGSQLAGFFFPAKFLTFFFFASVEILKENLSLQILTKKVKQLPQNSRHFREGESYLKT